MITEDELKKKYNISDELFQNSGMSWDELSEIYHDFKENKYDKYKIIMDDFISIYLKDINEKSTLEGREVKIHSVCSRVKDAEHLIVKIIRKKQENHKKYKDLNKNNYEKFLTDLIGIRCLVLFKDDWESFHYYLMSRFENDEKYYVRDSITDFDDNHDHNYIAEKPKVHIRNGDARGVYEKVLSPDCVIDSKVYRAVHYILKYSGVYLEIQVRTLFEEGWGEVDHAIVYPYYQNDEVLNEYTELLNRLSGLADEMSGFFYRLKQHMNLQEHPELFNNNNITSGKPDNNNDMKMTVQSDRDKSKETVVHGTPNECLQQVLSE